MKYQNKYDLLIEKLVDQFSNIKNFNLLQDDTKGGQVFKFFIKRIADINSFKYLITHYYLPAASKSVADDLIELNKSKYRHLIKISSEELKENYYETIRLAYIAMFHKFENYLDDLIDNAEFLISDVSQSEVSLSKYVELNFHYKLLDWKNSPIINRINWISNCNKHYNGYPLKTPKHQDFLNNPENEKLKLTKEDFVRDIDALILRYTFSLQLIFTLAVHKMTFEESNIERDNFIDDELNQKLIDCRINADEQIMKLLEINSKI
jgi:hypothetical protein